MAKNDRKSTASLSDLDKLAEKLLKADSEDDLNPDDVAKDDDKKDSVEKKDDEKKDGEDGQKGDEKKDDDKKDDDKAEKSLTAGKYITGKFKEITASVNLLKSALEKSTTAQDDAMDVFAKAFSAIAQTQTSMADILKSIGGQVTELNNRLNTLENQPQGRKSVGNLNVFDKNFKKSAGAQGETLSKSEIGAILADELFKGNPNVSKQDVIRFESGAPLRPEVQALLNNRAKQ